jgi:hypothetical protein
MHTSKLRPLGKHERQSRWANSYMHTSKLSGRAAWQAASCTLKIKAAKPLGITKIYALICYPKKSQFEFHSGWGAQAQQADKIV